MTQQLPISKKVKSRAPFRLGLGGGGSDLSPYCDQYGGYVLNAAISMYAYCTIEYVNDGTLTFCADDINAEWHGPAPVQFELNDNLKLHKAIYNRIVRDYNNGRPLSIKITTFSEAPPGSGLGSSSTMTVAVLAAYTELLNLPFGEYDLAHLAYEIERIDCNLSGGKQDQYAATFGGVNFMEFYNDDRVIVNPLRLHQEIANELQSTLLLYYTGQSRESANIVNEQIKLAKESKSGALEAMHQVKQNAIEMKEALLTGQIHELATILRTSWEAKKQTAHEVSNPQIDALVKGVMDNQALAAKISGAGGGGYMMIMTQIEDRAKVIEFLRTQPGTYYNVKLETQGAQGWVIQ